MLLDNFQIQETLKRYDERTGHRERNERMISQGRLLQVDSPERVEKFLKRRGLAANVDGGLTVERVSVVMAGEVAGLPAELALERFLGTNDLMGVAFLEEGLRVARTVARIWVNVAGGQPCGLRHRLHGFAATADHQSSCARRQRDRAQFAGRVRLPAAHRRHTPRRAASFGFEPQMLLLYQSRARLCGRRGARHVEQRPLVGGVRPQPAVGGGGKGDRRAMGQHRPASRRRAETGEPAREPDRRRAARTSSTTRSDTAPGLLGRRRLQRSLGRSSRCIIAASRPRPATARIRAIDGTPWRPEMGEDRIKWIANEGSASAASSSTCATSFRATRTARCSAPCWRLRRRRSRSSVDDRGRPAAPPRSGTERRRDTTSPDGTATWTIPLT